MNPAEIERYRNRILVVYSPDGGNGKSEIAANLAFSLAQQGNRIWVLDANTFAPTQDIIFTFPVGGPTFVDYLTDRENQDLPRYDLSVPLGLENGGMILLTPSRRDPPEARFRLQDLMDRGEDVRKNIPEAIFRAMVRDRIDFLLIDTHPGFEEINQVFLGLAGLMLIVSRINDVDLNNLRALLQDAGIADIRKKLIVFNNIQLDEHRRVSPAMRNAAVLRKVSSLKCVTDFQQYFDDFRKNSGLQCDGIEIYDRPFLYSRALAQFGELTERKGLFVQRAPQDPFSENIHRLAALLLKTREC